MNLFAYYSPDFYSERVPACADGNTGETLRGGGVIWNRAIGFTHLEDLAQKLRQFVNPEGAERRSVESLGILCHGQPGGLKLLQNGAVLRSGDLARQGATFQGIAQTLQQSAGRGQRSTVIFLACAAAAEAQGLELFELISSWTNPVVVVGFTRLLVSAAVTPRDLGDGGICLPMDIAVTEETYNANLAIEQQGAGAASDESTLPGAGVGARRAVRFLNGHRLPRDRRGALWMPGREFFRPTHAGRPNVRFA